MNYGVSSVRLDFAQIARLQTSAFFGIPGTMTAAEVVSVYSYFLSQYAQTYSRVRSAPGYWIRTVSMNIILILK